MSNENKVVLPEPDAVVQSKLGDICSFRSVSSQKGDKLYTEQQVRALLATGGQAQAVKLLAADHSGMKVDYRGLFSQVQRALKRTDPGYAEMLRQLEGHLQELGQRWYAGDTDVVDEILQLYCIERDARKTVGVTETAAPQAQADLYKAKADRYDFIVEKKLILSGGTEQFGWPIAPFGSECDRYIDDAIATTKKK